MPSAHQMEQAQIAYDRRLDANQNAELARREVFARQLGAVLSAQNARRAALAQHVSPGVPFSLQFFAACLFFGVIFATAARRRASQARSASRTSGTLNCTAASGILNYTAAPSLLTPTEAQFHAVLQEAIGPMATIQCKVRLADLLVAPRHDLTAFRRVSQKHVDFVLCDRRSLRPLVAVELDDPSHNRPDRMARDAFVDAAYAQAGLPLIHVRVRDRYNTPELLALVQTHLVSSSVSSSSV